VIVAHLKGLFVATGESTGLNIPANTCVIVYNEIQCQSPGLDHRLKGRDTQAILMKDKGFCSISGGIIHGNFQPYHVINAPGKNIAIIDGVIVKASGFNGITTKHHGGLGMPMFIRGCTVVDSRNRGIWAHVSRDIHMMDNVCSGNIADGIDFDAFCMNSTALFNTCTGNFRDGIFVEEGVKNDLMFGNILNGNNSCGIGVWNQAVTGNTGQNVMACNVCNENGMGISVGGRSADISSHNNFLFNNVCRNNLRAGMRYGNSNSKNTYWSQMSLRGNPEEVVNHTGDPITMFFNAPDLTNK